MAKTQTREELERWLSSVVIVAGEGSIQLDGRGPVYVSIVHDASGYNPAGAIVVDQNPYHDLSNETLEAAVEIMTDEAMKDEKHVEEIKAEWGDRWEEILTEAFDGKSWTFSDPKEAAEIIAADKRASEFIEIDEGREEENAEKENPDSEEEGWRSYGPGKFDSIVSSYIYEISGDGVDEEVGDVEGFGWYGVMGFDPGEALALVEKVAKEQGDELTDEEREELKDVVGVILSEDSQGFVSVDYFEDKKKLEDKWDKIEDAAEEFYEEAEEA